jgi:primary-amine oxidase
MFTPLYSFLNSAQVFDLQLSMHHVPHTGDLPNTVITTAQLVFIISPCRILLFPSEFHIYHRVLR